MKLFSYIITILIIFFTTSWTKISLKKEKFENDCEVTLTVPLTNKERSKAEIDIITLYYQLNKRPPTLFELNGKASNKELRIFTKCYKNNNLIHEFDILTMDMIQFKEKENLFQLKLNFSSGEIIEDDEGNKFYHYSLTLFTENSEMYRENSFEISNGVRISKAHNPTDKVCLNDNEPKSMFYELLVFNNKGEKEEYLFKLYAQAR